MKKLLFVVTWLTATIPLFTAICQPLTDAPSNHEAKADAWVSSVVSFISNPYFYRDFPQSKLEKHFAPLVPIIRSNVASSQHEAFGTNPDMGISWMRAAYGCSKGKCRLEYSMFVMPQTDPAGTKLLPLLKSELEKRLRKPDWQLTAADQRGPFWRRGKTNETIDLSLDNFQSPTNDLPNNGPWILLTAAKEEGNSEEP
jgi:hypothetical protein